MGISLSFSAAERFLLSPRSWFLHYMLRLRTTELSSALFFGSAMDDALNYLLLNRTEESLLKAKQIFEHKWTYAEINGVATVLSKPGTIKYSKADLDYSLLEDLNDGTYDLSWQSLREKGFLMLEAYYTQIIPRIREVIAVQEEIALENEVGDKFTGIIDLVVVWEDGRRILFDNKTTSIKYKDDSVQTSGQLATYWEAVQEKYKLDACGYITIPKKIRKQKLPLVPIEVIIGSIPDRLIEETFDNYDRVLYGIKNGQFQCTPDKCCSKPWGCSYERYCKSNGADLSGLEYQKERKK